ncbi:helix-turn-helix domain-containing protein [Mycobacterium sp. IDR2000157661]|uniref:helix-turn-helix domain-containing protein n=1 Tax=Mycobacterium sp. IDR2000157661 TaxID=2867005 RepID=UPI001EEB9CF9|nr:helix-turn-helix domain-containing protein [Mycobacterium sp. IDR2000157661]ULE34459.1 helix-turn-helix domain-containing protein [Mycobacterium sp. IDR2000157661]
MRGANSAPTERVLDVIELLSHPPNAQMRFSDIVRELNLSQATAHAILKTLTDRGWVGRDPVAKTFSLGPTLALIAARLDAARPMAHLAHDAARRLATTVDVPASVIERAGDDLVITSFEQPKGSVISASPNERIPYTAPFGVAFAAWDTPDAQRAWIERAAADDRALTRQLYDVLAQTRERGYDVDWMTPALAQAAQAIGSLSEHALPVNMRSIIEQLRVEFTSAALATDNNTRSPRPVATISAPVLDRAGHIQLVLGIHPVRPMTMSEVRSAAQPLLREIAQLTNDVRA